MLALAIKAAVNEELTQAGLERSYDQSRYYVQMFGGTESDAAISYSDMYYGVGGIPPFTKAF